jgi:hypothetical protein
MDGRSSGQFCETLFKQACELAQVTKPQMVDLLKAFRQLQVQEYASQYGQVHGEWNEGIAIVKAYTIADIHLLPEIGLSIAQAIRNWHQYSKIGPEQKNAIEKAVQKYAHTIEVYLENLRHFFNQLTVHATHLNENETDRITDLIKNYQLQTIDAYHKGKMDEVNSLLHELVQQLTALCEQKEAPSRALQQLTQKAQQHLPLWK